MSGHVLTAERIQTEPAAWGSPIEQEVRRRIQASVATFAYEIADKPIVDDATWDFMVQRINPRMGTCHPHIDEFFAYSFSPMTGLWIHDHPEIAKIEQIHARYYRVMGEAYFARLFRR